MWETRPLPSRVCSSDPTEAGLRSVCPAFALAGYPGAANRGRFRPSTCPAREGVTSPAISCPASVPPPALRSAGRGFLPRQTTRSFSADVGKDLERVRRRSVMSPSSAFQTAPMSEKLRLTEEKAPSSQTNRHAVRCRGTCRSGVLSLSSASPGSRPSA